MAKYTKRLLIRRRTPQDELTFGELSLGTSRITYTMEPGNKDVSHPRVNPGFYVMEPHGWNVTEGTKYKDTWALIGKGVSHFPEPGIARSAILMHHGNLDSNTLGCILQGMAIGELLGKPALLQSDKAMDRLRELIGNNYAWLEIEE